MLNLRFDCNLVIRKKLNMYVIKFTFVAQTVLNYGSCRYNTPKLSYKAICYVILFFLVSVL